MKLSGLKTMNNFYSEDGPQADYRPVQIVPLARIKSVPNADTHSYSDLGGYEAYKPAHKRKREVVRMATKKTSKKTAKLPTSKKR